ncbi:MAG: PorT family protein [Flavobacteriales bacterium]|nr:PorT family protein [Flavobacteriales bacterium]MCB9447513.1 PorT family protein [Flavobacteriales bacterium]
MRLSRIFHWLIPGLICIAGQVTVVNAQQPGMTVMQPIGIKPFGVGKKSDVEQLQRRRLVVAMEDEKSLDIRSINKSLKKAVEDYWYLAAKDVLFLDMIKVEAFIQAKDTNYVILQMSSRQFSITELPEEDAPTSLDVRRLEIYLPENKRRIATIRMPDDIPSLGEVVIGIKQMQAYLHDRGAPVDEDKRGPKTENHPEIGDKTLLIDKKDFRTFSSDDIKEVRYVYPKKIEVVAKDRIEQAIMQEDSTVAFVQLVHYRRTQSLHYIISAKSGEVLGHFKARNSLGDYLHYHQYVTMKHVKRYGNLADVKYAGMYTKRFNGRYANGMEISPRVIVQQSLFEGKAYRNKTVFTERVPEVNKLVSQHGETTYLKTVGVAMGGMITTYVDTTWSLHAGLFYSVQGQRFRFTHYDSIQGKVRNRSIDFKLDYLKVPLQVGWNSRNTRHVVFQVTAGPQIGILANAKELIDGQEYRDVTLQRSFKEKSDQIDFSGSMKSIDISALMTAGVYLKLYGQAFLYLGGHGDISIRDADNNGRWKDPELPASRNITFGLESGISYLF